MTCVHVHIFHFLSPLSLPQYNGITLFMINDSILVKTACNNLDNFAINHERFYYVRKENYLCLIISLPLSPQVNSSAISVTGCYTPTTGCRDFCVSTCTSLWQCHIEMFLLFSSIDSSYLRYYWVSHCFFNEVNLFVQCFFIFLYCWGMHVDIM